MILQWFVAVKLNIKVQRNTRIQRLKFTIIFVYYFPFGTLIFISEIIILLLPEYLYLYVSKLPRTLTGGYFYTIRVHLLDISVINMYQLCTVLCTGSIFPRNIHILKNFSYSQINSRVSIAMTFSPENSIVARIRLNTNHSASCKYPNYSFELSHPSRYQ